VIVPNGCISNTYASAVIRRFSFKNLPATKARPGLSLAPKAKVNTKSPRPEAARAAVRRHLQPCRPRGGRILGHHRPNQGRACGDPERSLGCGAADHHRGHGGRSSEEERRCRRHASGRWRHGWYGLLSPTVRYSTKERPGKKAGPFSQ
jgi:hypothetical protein